MYTLYKNWKNAKTQRIRNIFLVFNVYSYFYVEKEYLQNLNKKGKSYFDLYYLPISFLIATFL